MSRPGPDESECRVNWCDKTAEYGDYCYDHRDYAGDEKDSDWVF